MFNLLILIKNQWRIYMKKTFNKDYDLNGVYASKGSTKQYLIKELYQ